MYIYQNGDKLFGSSGNTFGSMGSSNKRPESIIKANREAFLKQIDIEFEDCVVMNQSHSDKVVKVSKDLAGGTIKIRADGMVSEDASLALVITSADCVPIGFYDSKKKLLGAVHAGWKGADLGIVGKVVKALIKLGGDPDNIEVVIGPAIAASSYVCKNPVQVDRIQWQGFLKKTSNGIEVDVIGKNVRDLLNSGIRRENMVLSGVDTFTNPNFYSYRRHKNSGEMMWNVVAFIPLIKTGY